MINDNEPDKIDDFFDKHFANLPKFKESENKEKILLNTLFSKIDEQSHSKNPAGFEKKNILVKLKLFFVDFSIFKPKYAITFSAILIAITTIVVINLNLGTEQKTDISSVDKPQNNTVKKQEPSEEAKDIVSNNTVESEEQILDLGSISYDFSTRGESNSITDDSLAIQTIAIIEKFLKSKSIKFTKTKNKIETEWLYEKENNIKIILELATSTKLIKMQLVQKQIDNTLNQKEINTKQFKLKLQDKLSQQLNSLE